MANENYGGMRPERGDTTISLPMTFDYSSGRAEFMKTRRLVAIIVSAISLITAILLLFNSHILFYRRVLLFLGIIIIAQFIVRFIILQELKVRKIYEGLVANNYELKPSTIWGIYTIEPDYPYFCRFKTGKSGVFVRLNKDVILGKYSESEFNHYEAIADAYNLAGGSKVQICHIDYMDNVGTDERLEESFISLGSMSNPDLKDLLMDIFSYQQEQMMRKVTTFDTYLFLWSGTDTNGWATVQRILACFLDANYRSYHILDADDIRELVKVLFNLNEFSIINAATEVFDTTEQATIVPIKITHADGSVDVLNKTVEEKKKEQEAFAEEEKAKEAEKKRRKAKKGKTPFKDEEVEFDIF